MKTTQSVPSTAQDELRDFGMIAHTLYRMHYTVDRGRASDWVGGLPSHLPCVWPLCQLCQHQMSFVGQLYGSDWFPIDGHLALQFYVCDACGRTTSQGTAPHGSSNPEESRFASPLHMEVLPIDAVPNSRGAGLTCRSQPKMFIWYEPLTATELCLPGSLSSGLIEQADWVGEILDSAAVDSQKVATGDKLMAQFRWQGVGRTICLFKSGTDGLYPRLIH